MDGSTDPFPGVWSRTTKKYDGEYEQICGFYKECEDGKHCRDFYHKLDEESTFDVGQICAGDWALDLCNQVESDDFWL